MKKSAKLNVLASSFIGAFIWFASPYLTGELEPWDSETFYYIGSLLLGGIILGLYNSEKIWAYAIGIFLGQLIYSLLFLPLGPLVLIGSLYLAASSLVCYLGAIIGKVLKVYVFKQQKA